MSQRSSRRRSPVTVCNRRKLSNPSPTLQRRIFLSDQVLNRSSSEPNLETAIGYEDLGLGSVGYWVFYRPQTCTDIFSPSSSAIDFSPQSQSHFQCYSREAKVVVKVEVEGSPGPVRILVKLGLSITDTIKLVMQKYGEEGRTPKIPLHSASSYELHSSYFSLQSLDESAAIGDVGSRSFYLRKSNNVDGRASSVLSSPPPPTSSAAFFLPGFMSWKMGKFLRRACKFWKILICMGS